MEMENAVRKTINYFNLFNFPLTDWEVYKNLWRPARQFAFSEIQQELARMAAEAEIGTRGGFFFLKRKRDLVFVRKQKYLSAQKKMKKACFGAKIISLLPFTRVIFVCNDLAYFNAPSKSDIDFAIIAANGRIWTARFLSAGLMALLHRRPTPESRVDKICLSFYCSEDNLNLQTLAYDEDIHFVYWLSQFMPLYGEEKIIENFYFENRWLREYLPNSAFASAPRRWRATRRHLFKFTMERLLSGCVGDVLEKLFKKIQLKILPVALTALSKENSTDVVISDNILKLHNRDTRLLIKKKWEQSLYGQIKKNN